MKWGLLISLVFLTGCNWWDSSPSPSDVYTAEFALNGPVPTLTACQGIQEVGYHVSKCFKNGVETDLQACYGLVKPPLRVKSPAGTVTDELYNYKDETIGYNIFNCNQGEVKLENPSDVSCTDSRYIRQNNNGHLECNPYMIDLVNGLTSEYRRTTQFENSNEYLSVFNREIPGYNKGKIWDPDTNLFYQNTDPLELDDNYNNYELLDWNQFCALYTDSSHYCLPNSFGGQSGRDELLDGADAMYFGGVECSRKGIKYYCKNLANQSIEVLEMDGVEEFYAVGLYHVCYFKNDELWCSGPLSSLDPNVLFSEGGSTYVKIAEEKPLAIQASEDSICIIKSDNYLYCIGETSKSYSGMSFGLITSELMKNNAWPKLKSFKITGTNFIGLGLDNQLYQTNINNDSYFNEESNEVAPVFIKSNKISN